MAFSKEILGHVGFVSLVQIKEKFEEKDQKCEVQTAGEMGGKNFIQNCRRVNAEKFKSMLATRLLLLYQMPATSASGRRDLPIN